MFTIKYCRGKKDGGLLREPALQLTQLTGCPLGLQSEVNGEVNGNYRDSHTSTTPGA